MRSVLHWIGLLLLMECVVAAQLFVNTFFYEPLRFIILPVVTVCMCTIFWRERAWHCTVLLGFCLELFSHLQFGVVFAAVLISGEVMRIFLQRIFTSLSLPIVCASVFIGCVLFMSLQKIFIFLLSFSFDIYWTGLLWGSGLSALLAGFLFLGITIFLQRINPAYIRH